LVIAGISKGPHGLAIGESTGNSHKLISLVSMNNFGHNAQGRLNGRDGIMNQAFAECHQEQGLAVCGAFSVRIVHVVDEIFYILSAVLPIADLAVGGTEN
jgi:hypothetical protein